MRYTLADLERVLAVCGHVGLGRTPDEVCAGVIRAHDLIVELRELEARVRELEALTNDWLNFADCDPCEIGGVERILKSRARKILKGEGPSPATRSPTTDDTEPVFDWYCECCEITVRSPVLAVDDWYDGLPNAVGPDCPECDCQMERRGEGKT